jgi:ABC-2 type transport system permease protein
LTGAVLVHAWPANWFVFFGVTVLVALLFGAIGLIFGLMAEKFDHIAIFTTFVITPLVFVGGVFARVGSLPGFVRDASMLNPMFYMIDAFRYSYTGGSDEPLGISFGILTVLAAAAVGVALRMTATGYKLRA